MTTDFVSRLAELEERFEQCRPELELTVRDPEIGLEGYVVVHSTRAARGGPLGTIGKGGTRITPQTSLEEVAMLAKTMTLKNAAAGLKLGGAKSGIRADPKAPEFEKQYRRFAQLVRPILAEHGGPFGGFGFDIGGDPQHPIWICDELGSRRSFTGKPIEMGGTDYDRQGLAGLGVVIAAEEAMKHAGSTLFGARYSVQGIGAMGAAIVRYAEERGARLAFVSDPRIGGAYEIKNHDPILVSYLAEMNIEKALMRLKDTNVSPISSDQILFQQVDVTFPAAIQNVIDEPRSALVRSRFLVEAANNPCSPTARDRMAARGITVIPDFIANPGGIIAAYVELLSTLDSYAHYARDPVSAARDYIQQQIPANIAECVRVASDFTIPIHKAARYLALSRIVSESP
jgi:glutamate dehydrogenase (NAD(P)+)